MAGRPKQPIELLEYKGKKNLTKAEIEERKKTEVKAPSDKVIPPNYLPKNLKKEFSELASELIEIGIMTNLDNDALARYLVSEVNYQKVSKKMLATSLGPKSIDDFDKLSKLQERLFKQARAAAIDLGLTISSRCKLVVPKKEEPPATTPEEKLFGGSLR